jgi:DUF4097 and DUF4098 domain-containing protein YvlB
MFTKVFAVLIAVSCLAQSGLDAATTESNLEKSFTVKPGGQLVVEADQGSIEVLTTDGASVEVEVKRKLTGVEGSKAQEIFAAHEVTFDQDGDRVGVHAKFKEDPSRWFKRGNMNLQVHFRISVPKQFNLDLGTGSGSISSADIEGQVKAKSAGGNLKFGDIKGTLEVHTGSGSISAGTVTGVMSVKTAGGNIQLEQAGDEAVAETGSGSITVQSAKAKLSVRTHGGNLNLGDLSGPAVAETGSGSIQVKSAKVSLRANTHGGNISLGELSGPADVESGSGSIRVGQAKETLKAKTQGGNLDLGELSGPAEVSTGSGSIRVKRAHARLAARTAGGSIGVDDAQDTVLAETGSGSVSVDFSAQPKDHCRLTTSGGGIEVKLPEGAAFEVDASTGGGRVSTELPITSTVVGEHQNNSLKGKLNGGGKALFLRAGSGNVTIKKR